MKLKFYAILFPLFIFMGCKDRCNDDCPTDGVSFAVINESGKNLYQSPDQRYYLDSLTVRAINGDEEEIPQFGGSEGTLYIGLLQSSDTYIVGYNLTDFDTLTFDYTFRNDDCCGSVVEDFSIHRNGTLLCEQCGGELIQIMR